MAWSAVVLIAISPLTDPRHLGNIWSLVFLFGSVLPLTYANWRRLVRTDDAGGTWWTLLIREDRQVLSLHVQGVAKGAALSVLADALQGTFDRRLSEILASDVRVIQIRSPWLAASPRIRRRAAALLRRSLERWEIREVPKNRQSRWARIQERIALQDVALFTNDRHRAKLGDADIIGFDLIRRDAPSEQDS